ncbi:hypothetical protein D0C36_18535 [Mucilaginibacter conchicola]|uniref:Uncharacterized protein n=1 Tax=Mucilaginibacter conchicola TaxID=2303333 RepID=A0A372NPT0_9SPHI|nr:hypothetical protein [Mucilaginibacter conchicola]RFZ90944.1 hypothetical protein D0C36_18535 [Mucilaginibacter conchicola]
MKTKPNPKNKLTSPLKRLRFLQDRTNGKTAPGSNLSLQLNNLKFANLSLQISDTPYAIKGDFMALCKSENYKPLTGWVSEEQARAVKAKHEQDKIDHTVIINNRHSI